MVIGNRGDEEMMKKCKKEEGEIKEAIEQLEEMSADEKEREIYEIRERSRLVYNTEMYEAKKKGIEEGKLKKSKEIAKKMLEKNVDIETIEEITGLTKEEIEDIRKE